MKINKSKKSSVNKYAIGGIIAAGAQVALGAGQAIYGMSQAKKANAEMQRLLQGAPKLSLPSAYTDYAAKAADKASLNAQTESINRRLSTSTDALSSAGGRALLGGLNTQVTAANEAGVMAQDAQLQREMQGLQVLGGAQVQNQQVREQRFNKQYDAAAAAKNAALQNIGGGLSSAAKGSAVLGSSFEAPATGTGSAASGMKTKGEFSHENNPLTLTDKNGTVVGEATGGEYIVNPDQAAAISKESKFFRNLLKKKQFKG